MRIKNISLFNNNYINKHFQVEEFQLKSNEIALNTVSNGETSAAVAIATSAPKLENSMNAAIVNQQHLDLLTIVKVNSIEEEEEDL